MDECQSCTDVRGFGYYSVEDLEDWNISGETVNDGDYILASYPGSQWVGLGARLVRSLLNSIENKLPQGNGGNTHT